MNSFVIDGSSGGVLGFSGGRDPGFTCVYSFNEVEEDYHCKCFDAVGWTFGFVPAFKAVNSAQNYRHFVFLAKAIRKIVKLSDYKASLAVMLRFEIQIN